MISIKNGTQIFSENSNPAAIKSNDPNTLSADEQKKYFGDKDMGQILNEVADPNWVDPSKKIRTVGSDQLDKDAFMRLLLTQMKNQDPTTPLKSHEMAAQLAQFSSLEQLQNINTGIEGLTEKQAPAANFDALSMIGKTVSGDSSRLHKSNLEQPLDIRFTLAADANDADIKIKDSNGNIVREMKAFELDKGPNEITWDGKLESGAQARQGDYSVEITAKASNGNNRISITSIRVSVSVPSPLGSKRGGNVGHLAYNINQVTFQSDYGCLEKARAYEAASRERSS